MSATTEASDIAAFFKNKSIFITGATGFVGKQLVEKIVRSCPDFGRIYLLVRPKRGQNAQDRVKDLVACPLFNRARTTNPKFEEKIVALQGDIMDPNLGLSPNDESILIENCHIVFHSAATVRFNEPLRLALQMNVAAVKRVLSLCHKLKNVQSVLHISTAYANCNRQDVAEMVYPPPFQPQKLLDAAEWMDDKIFDSLTNKIIGDRPNTYTFTKAIAECVVTQESKGLPLAIVRPSIVGASWREPVPGWIDNFNGPTGFVVAICKGMLRSTIGNPHAIADIIPVDVCINMIIAVAWHTAVTRPKDIPVYNCCSGHLGSLTWGKIIHDGLNHLDSVCMENAITFPYFQFTESRLVYRYLRFVQETMPAFTLDIVLRLIGRKPMFMKISKRIFQNLKIIEYFATHSWVFHHDNSVRLQSEMSEIDQQTFNFDIKSLDWFDYWRNYCLGAKQYLLREDLANIPKCRKHNLRLKCFQNILWYTTVAIILKILFYKTLKFRRIIFFLVRFIFSSLRFVLKKLPIFHRTH